VLRPGSTKEVSEILKLANETGTPIVPQGGNTGLSGGQVPIDERAVVVSTVRLDKIREIDLASNSMTCEAGVILQRAQETAKQNDRLFPLSLGAEGSCTIGGNLSTNAGGVQALAYGVARDLVLGLEVVLADGRIWSGLRKLKKDNTGYDLRHLFMGAEGTLGIITAAVLKLFPAPRSVETAFVGLPSPRAASTPANRAGARGTSVTSFELMAGMGVQLAVNHSTQCRDPLSTPHPWYVLIELSSPAREGLRGTLEEILTAGSERGLLQDAAIASSLDQSKSFWLLRPS
jgi:D-lactate dehydrogenase (cytochrome)